MSEEDICPVCGILRDEELTPEAYEVIWDALPHLREAQEAGEVVRCEECGRRRRRPTRSDYRPWRECGTGDGPHRLASSHRATSAKLRGRG